MAHIHKKMKNGRPYFYIRETARVNGKPKVVNQVYLGTVEKILSMATGQEGFRSESHSGSGVRSAVVSKRDREGGRCDRNH